MPSPFGSVLDLKLIKLVEGNPSLYNNKVEGYLESNKKEMIWRQIGQELEMPASLCKSRWVTIRDNMRRKMKGREKKTSRLRKLDLKPKYKYEDELQFIIPFYKANQQDEAETNEQNVEEYLDEDQCFEEEQEMFIDLNETKPNASSLFAFSKDVGGTSGTEKCFVSTSSASSQERVDPINVFLDAVALTLRNLNPYYLNQAKSKIYQVVQDCELQQIVNKGEHPPGV